MMESANYLILQLEQLIWKWNQKGHIKSGQWDRKWNQKKDIKSEQRNQKWNQKGHQKWNRKWNNKSKQWNQNETNATNDDAHR